ncbi:MAG: LysR family transcriptional regulator, partial [Verrucomicrobia bacterium 21-51-4]
QSFSRAARINGITQSAVSQQLRSMEKQLGVFIIDRTQKQFRLTTEGAKLQVFAQDILHQYDVFRSELEQMSKVLNGNIQLSTICSIGLHQLPPYHKRFLQLYPQVNVRIEYRRSNLVYEDVMHGMADIGLVAYPEKLKDITTTVFQEDHVVVIASPQNPLAKNKSISLEQIAEQNFIAFDADIPTGRVVGDLFREMGLKVDPVMTFDNIETVKRAVEIDAGIAFVPAATVTQEVKQGILASIEIADKKIIRPLAIIHRKSRVLSPAIERFIEIMTQKNESQLLQISAQ